MELKKDILWRVYLMYVFICIFGLVILFKVARIQFAEGELWKSKAKSLTTAYRNIEAVRGNIFAGDGSLLATSVPIYEIRMDLNADPITDKIFNSNVDSLAICLSNLFKDKTPRQYAKELRTARKKGARYHFIQDKVRFNELKQLREFPLFRLGKYKGGLITIQNNKRELPFRELAARTLGYERAGIKPIGIEGAYNNYLEGVGGKRLMQKIAGGVWMPINDENEIEPEDGSDVYTCIDVNIQDVAHNALLTQLQKHNAHHGSLALMEVQTGEIRAIVNLTRTDSGQYHETYNYIIGESTEPGSTFKLASVVAAMEDGYADLDDTVNIGNGVTYYYDRRMPDTHFDGNSKITLQQAFEKSSNVGISKIIVRYYQKDPKRFVDRLSKMNLTVPLGLEIPGEGKPYFKSPKTKEWYGTTLPWMSIGYEERLAPIQILAFYNAIANDGRMVKPVFVREIKKRGTTEKAFAPTIINESICSMETIRKAKVMLEGVVERGTASILKQANYKVAGKTGTAQISNEKYGYKTKEKVSYQASFVGYFPADKPRYTCIVVVNAPSNGVYYGGSVACPIFREVADKVYSTSVDMHRELRQDTSVRATKIPYAKGGHIDDIKKVASKVNFPLKANTKGEWVATSTSNKTITAVSRKLNEKLVPNVIGMAINDAVYLLENKGLNVKFKGKGLVTKQVPEPGVKLEKGNTIILELI